MALLHEILSFTIHQNPCLLHHTQGIGLHRSFPNCLKNPNQQKDCKLHIAWATNQTIQTEISSEQLDQNVWVGRPLNREMSLQKLLKVAFLQHSLHQVCKWSCNQKLRLIIGKRNCGPLYTNALLDTKSVADNLISRCISGVVCKRGRAKPNNMSLARTLSWAGLFRLEFRRSVIQLGKSGPYLFCISALNLLKEPKRESIV